MVVVFDVRHDQGIGEVKFVKPAGLRMSVLSAFELPVDSAWLLYLQHLKTADEI